MKKNMMVINRYSDIVPISTLQINLTKRQIEYIIDCINEDQEKFRSVGMNYILKDLMIEHYNLSRIEENFYKQMMN
jgi:hypothetical protein